MPPYFSGLRKRRSSETSADTTSEDENESNFFSQLQEEEPPLHCSTTKKRRVTHFDAEIISKFDPGQKSTNVKGWLHKIDQLGDLYEWDERDKIFAMQIRLRGAAREWYDDLDDYGTSWTNWKDRLTKAFPRSSDFVDRLEEMLARKKNNQETMTKYFHDKMSLLKKCSLEGEAAISCVIRGLPIELQANAKAYSCDTSEELYYGFLSSLENYKKVEVKTLEANSSWQRGTAANTAPKICYSCRKTGHEARDCRSVHCQVCQRLGHAATACWYAAGTSQPTSRVAQYTTSQQNGSQTPQRALQFQKNDDNPRPIDRRESRQMQDGRMLQTQGAYQETTHQRKQ